MGRPNREALKRKLAQAHYNTGRSGLAVWELQVVFQDVHPELAGGLALAYEMLSQVQTILEMFAQGAWNMDKEVFNSYRGVPDS